MNDLDAIRELEKILGEKLPQLKEIKWHSHGYTKNKQGQVTGVGLSGYSSERKISDLTEIIAPLEKLSQLTTLNLRSNQISEIAPLEKLSQLTELDLGANQISDIAPLEKLSQLTTLYLQNNKIEKLPRWIVQFKKEILWEGGYISSGVSFFGNPLQSPPPEIIKQGKEAIAAYFAQLDEQKEDYLL